MPLEHSEDYELSVPYGYIRGKIWNNPSKQLDQDTVRILALHGWQDNCGSFDMLIPNMSDHYYVVAIDFPGHGLSSHLPAGCPYNDVIFVVEIERIIRSLGWKDHPFTIMGHSMGAAIALFYSCLYPNVVQRVIALDMIKPLTFPADKLAAKTREGIEQFLLLDSKNANHGTTVNGNKSIPLYSTEEAIGKLISAHSVFGHITPEGARCLLKRGAKQSVDDPTKVFFTRDNRLKAMLFQRMDSEALLHYFTQLKCELLIVKAEKGVKLDSDDVSKRYIELYSKQCSRFEYITVPGGHHVHLCQSEQVLPSVVKFIDNVDITINGDTNEA